MGQRAVVRRVVVDHVSLRVADLEASRRFYTAALAPLGFGIVKAPAGGAAFGVEGNGDFWILSGGTPSAKATWAPAASSRAAVRAFYDPNSS
jgi:catechol 2,3-dioxygenase-like lactoylglutathione lyase family enzyme